MDKNKPQRSALDLTEEELARALRTMGTFEDAPLLSDIDIGKAFADIFVQCLRYCTTAKKWYTFNGLYWEEDNTKEAERVVERFVKAVYLWALNEDSETQKRAVKLQTQRNRKTILEDAEKHLPITADDFDQKPHLFNCKCGTFNLDTFRWEGERQYWGDYLTKCANVSKRLDDFGSKDYKDVSRYVSEWLPPDRAALVQQIAGLCLTEDVREEKFYIFYGATTRNGKSALVDSLVNMLGSYATTVNPETFSTNTRNGGNASPDRVKMKAARLISVSEFPKNTTMDSAYMKRLTGGDEIAARQLRQEEIEFHVVGKIILTTNWTPLVTDVSIFDSGRAVVVKFDNEFKEDDQDITLKDRLKQPEYADQFFYWALDGLKAYRAAGRLILPQSVREAIEAYRRASDRIAQFVDDCTEPASEVKTKGSHVFVVYEGWCSANHMQPKGKQGFFEELRRKGLLRDRETIDGESIKNVVVGVKLKSQYDRLP